MRSIALACAALAVMVGAVAGAPSSSTPEAPTRWVEDHAGFLSPTTRDALDARLQGYEQATGHQVVVWIGDTIGGADLAEWAVRTFAAWKVGRKGIDDGLVIFVLAQDRKIDIEVGYGLEDKVPDAIASRIIRDVMTPKLRAGDKDGAVTDGVNAVLTAIEGKPWAGGPAVTTTAPPARGLSTWQLVFGALAVIAFLIFAITHPRMAMFWLWTIMSGGRGGGWGGGSWGGGGGFGGGGGGFGGGGGSSGGGGARGGW